MTHCIGKTAYFLLAILGLISLISARPLNLNSCPWMDGAIEKDFAPFSSGITEEQIDRVEKQYGKYVRYKIINREVYGPSGKIANLLWYMCRHYPVPDVDFIYLMEDGFICGPKGEPSPPCSEGPVFASTKRKEFTHALFFADWNFDPQRIDPQYCSRAYDWGYICKFVEEYSQKIAWEDKRSTAFWRGGLQGYMHDYSPKGFFTTPRGKLCLYSSQNPQLLDAGTNWHSDHPVLQRLIEHIMFNPYKPFVDIRDQLYYKYQINVDGHTATYPGFQWRLLANCTVLKQETENEMWYFYALKPWTHYIPLEKDLSDLMEKIQWCINHDNSAYQIAMEGRKFAQKNLLPEHCVLYCFKALVKSAQLQTFQPKL